jgi:hypothetical protein
LTLTNVRGVPYKLYNDPNPGPEESISYYADRIRFETTRGDLKTSSPAAKPLPIGRRDIGAWKLLEEAAKATGAFPIFLAPRVLTREVGDYTPPCWESPCASRDGESLCPSFEPPLGPDHYWKTLNVDGGVCNNSPFQAAHDLLVSRNPYREAPERNPRDATKANCAVITVAPFPSAADYNAHYDPKDHAGIATMLPQLISVLISQSRFQGESLALATGPEQTYSRFVIAPSDPEFVKTHSVPAGSSRDGKPPALQCASLGAFGGFVARNFRAHDFLLGRRNCQQFLRKRFCLPAENRVIAAGLASAGPERHRIVEDWGMSPSGDDEGLKWIPLVPLCGTASKEVEAPRREDVAPETLDATVEAVLTRLRAIAPRLLESLPYAWLLRSVAWLLLRFPLSALVKSRLRQVLAAALAEPLPRDSSQDGDDGKATA